MTTNKPPTQERPALRRPMTEFEIKYVWLSLEEHPDLWQNMLNFARAIENVHGIKG
jgi:hypothetical protein